MQKKAIAFQKKFFKAAQGMDGSKSGKSSSYTHKSPILSDIILRYSYKSGGSTAACVCLWTLLCSASTNTYVFIVSLVYLYSRNTEVLGTVYLAKSTRNISFRLRFGSES